MRRCAALQAEVGTAERARKDLEGEAEAARRQLSEAEAQLNEAEGEKEDVLDELMAARCVLDAPYASRPREGVRTEGGAEGETEGRRDRGTEGRRDGRTGFSILSL